MINQKHTQHTLLERLKKFSNKRLPNTHNTKLLLVKTGLLIYKCYECELVEWRGKKLSLQLDHIDGNATNNSLSNLRLLCPNCHSQTETYCGKNRKKTNKRFYKKSFCKKCNKELSTPGLRNVWIVSTNTRNLKLKYVGLINKDLVIWYKTELAWNLLPESLE